MLVREISIAFGSTILWLGFGTVLTVWYFCLFFISLHTQKIQSKRFIGTYIYHIQCRQGNLYTHIPGICMLVTQKIKWKLNPKKKLTCHRGGSSGGVSLPHNDNIHPPCLILAQCWKDKTTAFFKIPGWPGPHKMTGLIIVWRSGKKCFKI